MTMNIIIIVTTMMKQGNACQLYPKVISFYSDPPHAIAWTEIGINIANSANMLLEWFGLVSFVTKCFGLIWFAWFWFCSVWFGLVWFGMTKLNSEPPHAIASTEIGINIANSANTVWLAFGLVWYEILWIDFMFDNMRGTRQIRSLCMLLKISLLQTGLQVDFGMCLQDIKGHDSG